MDNAITIKEDLLNKIWITKKCRINTAMRLENDNKFFLFLSFYYSVFLIILSIINLYKSGNYNSLTLVILSISTTFIVLFYNFQNYKERALSMKNVYIELDQIYIELKTIDKSNIDKILKISSDYSSVLSSVENHNVYDFLVFQYEIDKKNTLHISYIGIVKLFGLRFLYFLIKFSMIILPIIIYFTVYFLLKHFNVLPTP
ncbi:MAG: hypothetical protein A2015_13055 [Spirochaetes bacterium GWF1_31_7]|nr:MAG: hypothetical protein A2Y30_00460 [Spirochaetes bacterium GWE1_32_154]OHD51314.1 MAG: hypothetical protein A2Y29_00905 [Spirochaetes bacterium GWE2_31_10]OHD51511.1 MAG: hypothetical protein A2015_13055 [Spirochaetes bacterium GWF1_31_7]HBD95859.1 hypothetical protein [Spirochaetia bacterium]HBI38135.1 hypothetical protein [Spirochaetia bacterium]